MFLVLRIIKRHTALSRWNSGTCVFRAVAGDEERLRARAEAACLVGPRAKPQSRRSRRRNWIFLTRTTTKVRRLTDAGPPQPQWRVGELGVKVSSRRGWLVH